MRAENKTYSVTHTRTLTNGGGAGTYKVSALSLAAAKDVVVEPTKLEFMSVVGKSYTVRVTSKSQPSGTTGFVRFLWSDRKHSVAPIAFRWT